MHQNRQHLVQQKPQVVQQQHETQRNTNNVPANPNVQETTFGPNSDVGNHYPQNNEDEEKLIGYSEHQNLSEGLHPKNPAKKDEISIGLSENQDNSQTHSTESPEDTKLVKFSQTQDISINISIPNLKEVDKECEGNISTNHTTTNPNEEDKKLYVVSQEQNIRINFSAQNPKEDEHLKRFSQPQLISISLSSKNIYKKDNPSNRFSQSQDISINFCIKNLTASDKNLTGFSSCPNLQSIKSDLPQEKKNETGGEVILTEAEINLEAKLKSNSLQDIKSIEGREGFKFENSSISTKKKNTLHVSDILNADQILVLSVPEEQHQYKCLPEVLPEQHHNQESQQQSKQQQQQSQQQQTQTQQQQNQQQQQQQQQNKSQEDQEPSESRTKQKNRLVLC
jgi:hypothetical protein